MKRIAALTALSMAFTLGLASISSTAWGGGVTGKLFRVTVKSSFGTTFKDCFRFDVPATGDLTIDGLGEPVIYRHGQLNTVNTSFKAVSLTGDSLSIMFYGEEVVALKRLNGEAVNEFGDSFVLTGVETATCVPDGASSSVTSGTSPYRQ